MSLRDDASLILIPSAIKDGEVLVQKPLPNKFSDETGNYDGNDPQGSANLTFTRNSNATRVDADGLVEKVRTNSLLQSNQFDTTWTNTSSTETSGQAGYDGSNDAWKIDITAAFGQVIQSVSISGVSCASIYVKAGTLGFVRLRFDAATNAIADFNLSNGSVGYSFGIISASSTAIGGGWYRVSMVSNVSSSTFRIYPIVAANDLTATSGNIYIQDAQLEQGLVATSYIETTTTAMSEFAGVTASSVADVPRLDYSGGATCPSLLLEPQATALNLYSEQLDNAAWTKANLTATANQTASPTGYTDANKLSEQAVNGIHYAGQSIASAAAGTYTFSCFLKQGTTQYGGFRAVVNGFTNRYFVLLDLSNGTVVDTNTTASGVTWTHKVDTYTNGWYRLSITATHTSGNIDISISTSDTNSPSYFGSLPTYLGTNKYIYAWGANITSASYLQSYIPTYGTTVTRLADSTYVQNLITNGVTTSGGAYTIFFDLSNEPVLNVADGNSEFITLYSGQNLSTATISPRKYYNEADGKIRFYSNVDASNIGYVTSTNKKYAMSVNNNVVKLYSDGALQLTYTGTGNHNTLGSYRLAYGASNRTQAQFSQYIVFDSVLSDTECENLTA